MTDITTIFIGVITLISGILSCFVIPFLKSKLNAQQLATLTATVRAGVYAAEQLYKAGGQGERKKEYVLNYLKEKGYIFNIYDVSSEITNLIESTVKELSIEESST